MKFTILFPIILLIFNSSFPQEQNSLKLEKDSQLLYKNSSIYKKNLLNQNSLIDSDNLHFYNSRVTWSSIGKIVVETAAGAVLGYEITSFFYSKFKKIDNAGLLIIGPIYLACALLGGFYGANLGVYSMGNIFDDEGDFANTTFWSAVGGAIFYLASGIFIQNPESRLWITTAGLPIGAVFGFNTDIHLDDIFDLGWRD